MPHLPRLADSPFALPAAHLSTRCRKTSATFSITCWGHHDLIARQDRASAPPIPRHWQSVIEARPTARVRAPSSSRMLEVNDPPGIWNEIAGQRSSAPAQLSCGGSPWRVFRIGGLDVQRSGHRKPRESALLQARKSGWGAIAWRSRLTARLMQGLKVWKILLLGVLLASMNWNGNRPGSDRRPGSGGNFCMPSADRLVSPLVTTRWDVKQPGRRDRSRRGKWPIACIRWVYPGPHHHRGRGD